MWIINSNNTDLSSSGLFFVTDPILGLCNQPEEYFNWVTPSSASSGLSRSCSVFSRVFIGEEADGV